MSRIPRIGPDTCWPWPVIRNNLVWVLEKPLEKSESEWLDGIAKAIGTNTDQLVQYIRNEEEPPPAVAARILTAMAASK